ncbi:MAG: flavodoxin family protein [Patescibacteria group bacterium]|jgi:flavodoxin
MKTLIIYDSQFGNTEKIAQAIGSAFGDEARVVRPTEVKLDELKNVNLLIVGSPTQGGRPTPALQKFLDDIPSDGLKGIKVATFDTRFLLKDQNFALRMLMKTIGYAADKIIKILVAKGGQQVMPPEGFIVKGKEGPLAEGEMERADEWTKLIKI